MGVRFFESFPKGVESSRQRRGSTQRVGVGGPSSLMPDPSQWQLGSPPTSLPTQQAIPERARAWLLLAPPAGGAGALPARVGLAPRLHWGSGPLQTHTVAQDWERPGWPWTWLGQGGPYTQRDLEKGTIESPQSGALGTPAPWMLFPGTGLQDSSSRLHHERQGEIQTPELENPKSVLRCLLSSQGAQGESFGISFQQNQKRICFQRAKISLDLVSPPQICCSFPRECRDWWLRFRMSCFVTQFPLSNDWIWQLCLCLRDFFVLFCYT